MSGYFFSLVFSLMTVAPLPAFAADIVSGTLYSDQGITAVTSADKEIAVLVNGVMTNSAITDASGGYSVDTGMPIGQGDVVTAFVVGELNEHGASIVLADGPLVDLDIYYDYLVARHETGSQITRTHLETANDGHPDLAFIYDDDSVVFSLNNQVTFLVPAGNTVFMDSPTDSTGSFDVKGTLNVDSQDFNLEGDLVIDGILVYDTVSSPEITFDGSGSSVIDYTGGLPRLVVAGGGSLTPLASLDVNNGILVTENSTLDAIAHTIDLEGSIDVDLGSALIAPSTTMNIAGNINIQGDFEHSNGEIILDSGSDQDVFGNSNGIGNYNDFTIANSGERTVGFEEDYTYSLEGVFSADIDSASAVLLRTINATGAVVHDDSTHTLDVLDIGTINHLDIRDSVLLLAGTVEFPAQNISTTINRGNTQGWFDLSLIGLQDGVESGLDVVFEVVASVPNNTGGDVVIDYAFTGGTATPGTGNDFDDSVNSVVISNGQDRGQIIVPILQDTDEGEGSETIEITITSTGGDYDFVATPVSRTIVSTLIPEYSLSESSLQLLEGSQGAFEISLNRAPFGDVTFTVNSSDAAEVTVRPEIVSFNSGDWSIPRTITVESVDDDFDRDGDNAIISVDISATAVDSGFDNLADGTIAVGFTDNDETIEVVDSGDVIEIYRFWSALFRGHFYTISVAERDSLIANDPNWVYEGLAWYVPR